MKINPAFVEKILTSFIREELAKNGFKKGILGLSGGLDSAVRAALATRAIGPQKRDRPDHALRQGVRLRLGGCPGCRQGPQDRARTIDIAPMVDAYFQKHPTDCRILKGNKMARERMSILYDWSVREKALILGTSNKSELLIGYGTIHGDLACAFNPDRRLVQNPDPGARASSRAPGTASERNRLRPTSGPARRTKRKSDSRTPSSTKSSNISSKGGKRKRSSSRRDIPATGWKRSSASSGTPNSNGRCRPSPKSPRGRRARLPLSLRLEQITCLFLKIFL